VTGAVRADGAGAFGRSYDLAVYPKGSMSWLISDERFFPHNDVINTVRLRGAYGASGVQPGPTATLRQVGFNSVYVDGGGATGAILDSLGNQRLRPERQSELEAGIDLDLFSSRVHFEGTYYHKQSSDALVYLPDPPQLGTNGASTEQNVGSVLNWGYEALLNVAVVDARALRWDISVNASINHNRLLKLAPGIDTLTLPAGYTLHVGYPVFSTFAQPILHYGDANKNGIIDSNEVTVGPSAVYRGSNFPQSQWSLSSNLAFFHRALTLGVVFDHRGGFIETDPHVVQVLVGNARVVNDRHASLADQAAAVALYQYLTEWGYLDDATFTRLREVSASFELPQPITRLLRVHSATLTLAARNLLLWTRFPGVDPEVNGSAGDGGVPSSTNPFSAYSQNNPGPPPSQYWVIRMRLGM
jgi:hypothetical protein